MTRSLGQPKDGYVQVLHEILSAW